MEESRSKQNMNLTWGDAKLSLFAFIVFLLLPFACTTAFLNFCLAERFWSGTSDCWEILSDLRAGVAGPWLGVTFRIDVFVGGEVETLWQQVTASGVRGLQNYVSPVPTSLAKLQLSSYYWGSYFIGTFQGRGQQKFVLQMWLWLGCVFVLVSSPANFETFSPPLSLF